MKRLFRFISVTFGGGRRLEEGLSSSKAVPDTRHPMTQLFGMMQKPEVLERVRKGDITFVSKEGSIRTLQYKDGPDGFVKITFHNHEVSAPQ